MTNDLLTTARAEALFSSSVTVGSHLTKGELTAAVAQAIRRLGGTRGCAIALAGAYGEFPETAVPRMRWALQQVRAAYPRAGTASVEKW
ncbi:hypothetical protein [Streptomyces purpurogeneiscleroticus]|uniref:hypothetical protein n=1 Tax=Streptomyces purpurogeneiscleroticus TaxID=68259 RepID=UPI001CBE6312|nr:hypothetical protein [Streptomyces purpurogeneiscleroticus]MBZ4018693.1 hypothetical protein [Streptomyces purpurogeneiscleroticus]